MPRSNPPFSVYPILLVLVLAWLNAAVPATAGRPVALVIGNAAYRHAPLLINPKNDAEDMAESLVALGFKVLKYTDVDRVGMEEALDAFSEALNDANLSVLYYAGHAVQIDGKNYLIPVDAPILTRQNLVQLERLQIDKFHNAMAWKTRTNIIFLDACRDNPLGRSLASGQRSAAHSAGLAAIKAGPGSLISYATSPGQTAADGFGTRNSPFTASLKKRLLTPGKDLLLVMRDVSKDVQNSTGGRQVPWVSSSLADPVLLRMKLANGSVEKQKKTTSGGGWTKLAASLVTLLPSLTRSSGQSTAPSGLRICHKDGSSGGKQCLEAGTAARFRDRLADGRDCAHCPELVVPPSGKFVPAGQTGVVARRAGVRVSATWLIGRHEVSFAQWDACISGGGCAAYSPPDNGWGRGQQPVINVSFDDANRYLDWLSKVTGQRYELPTEAQWSYAARAGSASDWWWGETAKPANANFDYTGLLGPVSKTATRKRSAPVDTFDANSWGLKNVHGNVAEWTLSCWADKVDPSVNAVQVAERARKVDASCNARVVRGGGWDSYPAAIAASARQRAAVHQRRDNIGFRVIRRIGAEP